MNDPVISGLRSAKEIFFEALEKHSPQERAAFLDGACRGSPEQRAKVEALLANHLQADEFMQRPAMGEPAPSWAEPPAVEPRTAMVGRYKLLEKIGEGGFGEDKVTGSSSSWAEPPAVEPRTAMVGRYKLLEKIGEGGFGEDKVTGSSSTQRNPGRSGPGSPVLPIPEPCSPRSQTPIAYF